MRKLSFSELAGADLHFGKVSCVKRQRDGLWENNYPNGRSTNVLSLTVSGRKRLLLPGKTEPLFQVNGPSVFFIASGCPYLSRSSLPEDGGEGQTICIKFRIFDAAGEEIEISDSYLCWEQIENERIPQLFRRVVDTYLEAEINYFSLYSDLFRVLNALISAAGDRRQSQDGYQDILPAIEYLEKNPYKQVTVAELAERCFLSKSYFAKRFKQYSSGECVTVYRNRIRVKKAIELLDSSLWTMEMIAETLGFYDTSHFYRVFKQYTGKTPQEMKLDRETESYRSETGTNLSHGTIRSDLYNKNCDLYISKRNDL